MSQEKVIVRKVNISEKEKHKVLRELRSHVLANAPSIVRYVDHRVNIPEEQRDRFYSAIDNNEAVTIRFKHKDLWEGDDLITFTMQQFKRIASAFGKGRGVTINMSDDQVQRHEIVDADDYFYSPF